MLDYDALTFPLTLRRWAAGDSFRPLGMQGVKKVSDFLIDQKVPGYLKHQIYVLVTADREIAWIVGYRIDDKFKLTRRSKEAYHIAVGACDVKEDIR